MDRQPPGQADPLSDEHVSYTSFGASMKLVLLVLLAAVLHAQAPAVSDDTAIRDLVRRYLNAREQSSPAAVQALFTPDADQLVSTGEWRKGRDHLVEGVLRSSQANEGRRTITVESVRLIAPAVALADGRYEIAPPSGAPPRKMWTTFVVVKESNEWRIAAIRNMLPAPPSR